MTRLKDIFANAGYAIDTDRRNYSYKCLDDLLNIHGVNLWVQEKGRVWISPNGFRHNVRLNVPTGNQDTNGELLYLPIRLYLHTVSILNILSAFSEQYPKIKERTVYGKNINSCNKITCSKCNGSGYLPMFSHYCKGLCFDCMGIGFKVGELAL